MCTPLVCRVPVAADVHDDHRLGGDQGSLPRPSLGVVLGFESPSGLLETSSLVRLVSLTYTGRV